MIARADLGSGGSGGGRFGGPTLREFMLSIHIPQPEQALGDHVVAHLHLYSFISWTQSCGAVVQVVHGQSEIGVYIHQSRDNAVWIECGELPVRAVIGR